MCVFLAGVTPPVFLHWAASGASLRSTDPTAQRQGRASSQTRARIQHRYAPGGLAHWPGVDCASRVKEIVQWNIHCDSVQFHGYWQKLYQLLSTTPPTCRTAHLVSRLSLKSLAPRSAKQQKPRWNFWKGKKWPSLFQKFSRTEHRKQNRKRRKERQRIWPHHVCVNPLEWTEMTWLLFGAFSWTNGETDHAIESFIYYCGQWIVIGRKVGAGYYVILVADDAHGGAMTQRHYATCSSVTLVFLLVI